MIAISQNSTQLYPQNEHTIHVSATRRFPLVHLTQALNRRRSRSAAAALDSGRRTSKQATTNSIQLSRRFPEISRIGNLDPVNQLISHSAQVLVLYACVVIHLRD